MSPPELVRPKQPIAIRPEYTATSATSLHIKQGNISGSEFLISRGDGPGTLSFTQQPLLFTCQGKHLSLSQRRTFLDASGLPLIDLYRSKLSNAWYMELPEGKSTLPIVKLRPSFSPFKHKFDVEFESTQGVKMKPEVRGQDIWRLRTDVFLDGQAVMTITRMDKMKVYLPESKLEWVCNVAEGVDLLLASAIVVMMASTLYESSGSLPFGAAGSGSGASG